MDVSSVVQSLQQLPLPALVAVSVLLLVGGLVVLRVLSNTFHGRAPPVDEGIPFVGGLIKFSKVLLGAGWGNTVWQQPPPTRLAAAARTP